MAVASAIKETWWLRKLLNDLHERTNIITIMCDTQGALKHLRHLVEYVRSKHIHFARERVIQLQYCRIDKRWSLIT